MSMNVTGPRPGVTSFLTGVAGSQQTTPAEQPSSARTANTQARPIEWETAASAQKDTGTAGEKTRHDYTDALIGRYQADQGTSPAKPDQPFSLKATDERPFDATQVTSRLNLSDFPKPRPAV